MAEVLWPIICAVVTSLLPSTTKSILDPGPLALAESFFNLIPDTTLAVFPETISNFGISKTFIWSLFWSSSTISLGSSKGIRDS